MRLEQQLKSLASKNTIDHSVALADLTPLALRHLKEAFVIIKQIQDAVRVAWQLDRLA